MIPYPEIDPVLVRIGPIQIRWYGLMYALSFVASYFIISRQKRAARLGLQGDRLQEFLFYIFIGLLVGARLGYILFYQFHNLIDYARNPLEIIAVWHGGMSFHGGLAGAVLAGLFFCRSRKLPYWDVADTVIVAAPVGLFMGRIGNFINGELYGRPADVPWAMIFPGGGPLPRHPSQLYEAILEGIVLFLVLWKLKDRRHFPGELIAVFICGYGLFRFIVEFFREPDPQLGTLVSFLSMGQILSLIMLLLGVGLFFYLRHNPSNTPPEGGRRVPPPKGQMRNSKNKIRDNSK